MRLKSPAIRLFAQPFVQARKTSKFSVTGLFDGNLPVTVHKMPVTRKMFPFDDVITDCLNSVSTLFPITIWITVVTAMSAWGLLISWPLFWWRRGHGNPFRIAGSLFRETTGHLATSATQSFFYLSLKVLLKKQFRCRWLDVMTIT